MPGEAVSLKSRLCLWTQSRLFSRRWWLCILVDLIAIALDLLGRPVTYDMGLAIGAVAVALITMQTWLDTRIPCRGRWTPNRTLGRKWATGLAVIAGLFVMAGMGVMLLSATLTLVSSVTAAWIGSQTYLDYRAERAQKGDAA